ncbi:hypothetical protein FA09DRAFT_332560 [Tilletiopsis washingtonensis]|uniref:Ubiquitin-like domain-containing protein n=1 Tax=Tilletiopsis washingtonensis TaxID=58919 RepID=A0A316Z3Z4_9BASI|nr:hypothetical protein FA09DRAFT_332560 [Tilletiopsis washingtonensis]PWN94903.1 hypothetical protein FA09DRAFT_332560 [Tilletiopsis washingtonensis]
MPAAPTTANAESLAAARAESFKVVIVTHTGSEPSFKITKSSTIGELRAAYGEWQHVPVNQIRLIHHGHGLADEITGEYLLYEKAAGRGLDRWGRIVIDAIVCLCGC